MTLMTGLRKSGKFLLVFLPLLMTLGLIQALVVQGLADPPSNDENSPVKTGYVIVTPSLVGELASNNNPLVVFETFGQQRGQDVAQAGVLPASLSTDFLLFVSTSGQLSRNLGVAIANPGEGTAHVELTLLDEAGEPVSPPGTATIDLAAGQQSSRFVTEMFESYPLARDFTGTLRIHTDSNTPVAVMGLRCRGINFSSIPATPIGPISNLPEITSRDIGGDFAAILPHFAVGGGWASEIILINSGTDALDVRVDLFDKEGGDTLDAVFNGVTGHTFDKNNLSGMRIPPGGVFVLSPKGTEF